MIEIMKEKFDLGMPYESCTICSKGTQYWSEKRDIPVCISCAKKHTENELPTKEEWAIPRGKKSRNGISKSDKTTS